MDDKWRTVKCLDCNGHGMYLNAGGEPSECITCDMSGVNWIRPERVYYDRSPEDRITRAEWAGGMLLFVVLVALLYGGIFGCAWVDTHAPWLAGR